jgi:hypothetical protein
VLPPRPEGRGIRPKYPVNNAAHTTNTLTAGGTAHSMSALTTEGATQRGGGLAAGGTAQHT